jgi:kynurenine formamidase
MGIAAAKILVGLLAIALASTLFSQGDTPNHNVTQADMERWKVELSNWGRWGKDDQKGTLNLITPAKRKQAAALVKDGFAVSLARDAAMKKEIDVPEPYEDVMLTDGSDKGRATDRLTMDVHDSAHTHFDALGHHFMKGKMYNGYERKDYVTMEGGLTKDAVINAKAGVFTRGILMDIPRLKGVPYLEPGTAIYVEDLEAWEKQAGLKVSAGDAVFISTGRWVRRAKFGPSETSKLAGLDASVIPWLKKRDIALLGSEAELSVTPIPPTSQITDPDDYLPVHNFALVVLGMPLIDNCDLTALSEEAAARKRWEFLLVAAPLPLPTGTGSPINPIAIF